MKGFERSKFAYVMWFTCSHYILRFAPDTAIICSIQKHPGCRLPDASMCHLSCCLLTGLTSPSPSRRPGNMPGAQQTKPGAGPKDVLNARSAAADGKRTALHLSVSRGRGCAVAFRELLAAGADPTIQTTDTGSNVLHAAIEGAASGKVVHGSAMALHLIQTAKEPRTQLLLAKQLDSAGGRTPLMLAVDLQQAAVVEQLLARGVDSNTPAAAGRLPLIAALEALGGSAVLCCTICASVLICYHASHASQSVCYP